jgi:hypothetical protein
MVLQCEKERVDREKLHKECESHFFTKADASPI